MVLNQLRPPITKLMRPFYEFLAKLGVNPNLVTMAGLGLSIVSGWAFYSHEYAVVAITIFLAGFMDMLDGGIARVSGKASLHGAFLDSVADRVGEAAIYLGVILGFSSVIDQFFAISLLAAAFSVSYLRARGEGLGVELAGVGIMERAERLGVLFLAAILGMIFGYPGVVITIQALVVLTVLTAIHRFYKVYIALKETSKSVTHY